LGYTFCVVREGNYVVSISLLNPMRFGHGRREPIAVEVTAANKGYFLEGGGYFPGVGETTDMFLPDLNAPKAAPVKAPRSDVFSLAQNFKPGPRSIAEAMVAAGVVSRVPDADDATVTNIPARSPSTRTRRRFLTEAGVATAGVVALSQGLGVSPAAAAPYFPQPVVPQAYKNQQITRFDDWNIGYIPTPWKTGNPDWIPNIVKNANPANYTFATSNIPGFGNLRYFDVWNKLSAGMDNYYEFGPGASWPGHFANTTYPNGENGQFLYLRLNGNGDENNIATDYLTNPQGNPDGKVSALSYRFQMPDANFPEFHVLAKLGADTVQQKPSEVWVVVTNLTTGKIVKSRATSTFPNGQDLKFKLQLKGTNDASINNATQLYFRFHPDEVFLTAGHQYEVTFYAPTLNVGEKLQVRSRVYGEWPDKETNGITPTSFS